MAAAARFERLRPTPVGGNDVTLLQTGAEFFPALETAIAAARTEVWLETYIFADDPVGQRIATALASAAGRGVAVRMLVDGYGTQSLPAAIAVQLRDAGVSVLTYAPIRRLFTLNRERLRRLHRKQACVDGHIAFVGGINIVDDLHDPNHGPLEHPRFDYAVQLRGPVVGSVHAAMSRLWSQLSVVHSPLQIGTRDWSQSVNPPQPDWAGGLRGLGAGIELRPVGRVRAMLVLRDNLVHRRSIERAYLRAIGRARREVLIANAYFFPGRRFRQALKLAAGRGVRVRLLLQGRIEYRLPHYASQALYDELLRAGVEIVEYHRSFLHAKVAVIDDWSTVGSSNIDPFSLLLAREANVVVFDRGFAQLLRARLLASIEEGARPVVIQQHARRPWTVRLLNALAYRVLRLGVFVSGARRRF
jgi:cardiolipin synthase